MFYHTSADLYGGWFKAASIIFNISVLYIQVKRSRIFRSSDVEISISIYDGDVKILMSSISSQDLDILLRDLRLDDNLEMSGLRDFIILS